MARVGFGSKRGKVKTITVKEKPASTKSAAQVVRELKSEDRSASNETYRERSIAIHGLVCARCGRDFNEANRHLLTVHHKDGNHFNNPPDGSNWENLCVYCHEDVHSRGLLGDYFQGTSDGRECSLVYGEREDAERFASDAGSLGEKLKAALEEKMKKP